MVPFLSAVIPFLLDRQTCITLIICTGIFFTPSLKTPLHFWHLNKHNIHAKFLMYTIMQPSLAPAPAADLHYFLQQFDYGLRTTIWDQGSIKVNVAHSSLVKLSLEQGKFCLVSILEAGFCSLSEKHLKIELITNY